MITWIESLSGWDRRLPTTLTAARLTPSQRAALPVRLVADILGVPPHAVLIEKAEGHRPVVKQPLGSGLFLSMARRRSFTAVALAATQVGVDVELVDPEGDIPWNVLHSREATMLGQQDGPARDAAFARLWSLKEAYVKALGIGLFREPSSFAVSFVDGERAAFNDPLAPARVAEAETVWRTDDGARAAVSTVVLDRPQQSAR